MADSHADPDTTDYARGDMEIGEHRSTYRAFDGLVRWGSLAVAAIVLFLTLLCCTKAGLIGAAVPTVILIGAGVAFLRSPTSLDTH